MSTAKAELPTQTGVGSSVWLARSLVLVATFRRLVAERHINPLMTQHIVAQSNAIVADCNPSLTSDQFDDLRFWLVAEGASWL